MWSWVAHRITGVLTFFFLFAHVLDTALVRVSPESYDTGHRHLQEPVRQPDGDRPRRRRAVPRAERAAHHRDRLLERGPRATSGRCSGRSSPIWVVVMVPGAFFMFKHSFESLFGSACMSDVGMTRRSRRSSRHPRSSPQRAAPRPHQHRALRLAVHAHVRRRAGRAGARPPVHHEHPRRRRAADELGLRRRPLGLAVLAGLGPADAVAGRCCTAPTACARSSTTTPARDGTRFWLKGCSTPRPRITIALGTLVIFTFDPNI